MYTNNTETGQKGESLAEEFLAEKGFVVLKRNYRYGRNGEIDLIVQKQQLILFVEVKSRSSSRYGGALYSITNRKKQTIKKVARHFLQQNPLINSRKMICRFDLIAIENNTVKWIEDMFR